MGDGTICMAILWLKSKIIASGSFPFLLITKNGDNAHVAFNKARIFEGVMIAVITAVISGAAISVNLLDKLTLKFDMYFQQNEKRIDKIERNVDDIQRSLYGNSH